jgi:hypothetical protein
MKEWQKHGFLESIYNNNSKTDSLLNEFKKLYLATKDGKIFGIVTHMHDYYRYPEVLKEWFKFLKKQKAEIKTISEIIKERGYISENRMDIKVSSPIIPFPSHGDLWLSTWADDDSVFVSWGDGFGIDFSQKMIYSHHGLMKLRGSFPNNVEAEIVNRFMPLSDIKNNSKPSSLLFYNKRLYIAIHSPLVEPEFGFIAYSDDYGKSFGYNLATPWTKEKNSKFIVLMFINMGRDYSLNKDGYVYAFGIGKEVNWDGPVYLARVKKNKVLDYNAWEYFKGFDEKENPQWSKSQIDACPLKGLRTKHQFSSIYHPGIKKYIILMASDFKGELFTASSPWGPWEFSGEWFKGEDSDWFLSYIPGIISKDIQESSFYFAVAGTEPEKAHSLKDSKYKFRLGKITMDIKRKE